MASTCTTSHTFQLTEHVRYGCCEDHFGKGCCHSITVGSCIILQFSHGLMVVLITALEKPKWSWPPILDKREIPMVINWTLSLNTISSNSQINSHYLREREREREMEVVQVLCMNGGIGEKSYANNSLLQVNLLSYQPPPMNIFKPHTGGRWLSNLIDCSSR